MKNTLLLATIALLFHSSCNKVFQSSTPGSLNLVFNCTDLYVTQNGTSHFNTNLHITTGDISYTPITVSFQNLPKGVTISPSPLIINAKYNPEFTLTANSNSNTGIFPVQMVISTSGSDPQTSNFNIHIFPAENCASIIQPGKSHLLFFGSCSSPYYLVNYDTIANTPNAFTISNFGNYGTNYKLNVLIDCASSLTSSGNTTNIYVPKQTLNGDTISGAGYYTISSGAISLLYLYDTVITSANVKSNCTVEFE